MTTNLLDCSKMYNEIVNDVEKGEDFEFSPPRSSTPKEREHHDKHSELDQLHTVSFYLIKNSRKRFLNKT